MTPDMIAALSGERKWVTALYEFQLPSGTRRVMLGAGEAIWGANTFKGYVPGFGHIDTGEDVSESSDGVAPNTSVTIVPASDANRSDIASATIQLSPVKLWLAALQLDPSKHIVVVPDPELIFDGFIDQATINLASGRDEVDYSVISAFDYFFEDGEGQRLNGSFHQYVWPGETGLDNVTGVTKKIYWGANAPPGQSSGSSSIYSAAGVFSAKSGGQASMRLVQKS